MPPKATLIYFPSKGQCEPVRYLLAKAGIEFEDIRIPYVEWPKDNKIKYPFGKLPVLEIEGNTMYQSAAICRYLAKQQGLAGADAVEAQQIDALVDTICDIKNTLLTYGFQTEEHQKAKKKKELLSDTLPLYFSTLEKIGQENGGYLVNGKLSLADIFFAGTIEFLSAVMETELTEGRPTLQSIVEKVHTLPGIKEWLEKRPKTQY